jgi:hypothetical protein
METRQGLAYDNRGRRSKGEGAAMDKASQAGQEGSGTLGWGWERRRRGAAVGGAGGCEARKREFARQARERVDARERASVRACSGKGGGEEERRREGGERGVELVCCTSRYKARQCTVVGTVRCGWEGRVRLGWE